MVTFSDILKFLAFCEESICSNLFANSLNWSGLILRAGSKGTSWKLACYYWQEYSNLLVCYHCDCEVANGFSPWEVFFNPFSYNAEQWYPFPSNNGDQHEDLIFLSSCGCLDMDLMPSPPLPVEIGTCYETTLYRLSKISSAGHWKFRQSFINTAEGFRYLSLGYRLFDTFKNLTWVPDCHALILFCLHHLDDLRI